MDAFHIILFALVVLLLIDRAYDRYRVLRHQDAMNRAMLAKSVPEYDATAANELKRIKAENKLALDAAKVIGESPISPSEHRFPVT